MFGLHGSHRNGHFAALFFTVVAMMNIDNDGVWGFAPAPATIHSPGGGGRTVVAVSSGFDGFVLSLLLSLL